MSVGILKRLLSIVNVVAVLAIAWTAYGFVSHRSEMKEAWKPPPFGVPHKTRLGTAIIIDNTGIRLGAYPEPVEADGSGESKKEEVKLEEEIDKLGAIKSAIVVYPPYTDTWPAIIFEYKVPPVPGKGKIYAIQIGQALLTRPHSDPELRAWGDRENVRFEFVGCKPDPKNEGWTLFQFDIHCDGKVIKTARWKGETKKIDLPAAKGGIRPERTGIFRDPDLKKKPVKRKKPVSRKPGTDNSTRVPEVKPVKPIVTAVTGPIFESEGGSLATTESGIAYLRDNYDKILKDAQTTPYSDKSGKIKGLKVRRIVKDSVANEFGIRQGDVILKINGKPVSSKASAVNAVKRELNKKPAIRYIEVTVLRFGKNRVLRFDTRDPATRRKAKDAFRNR